MHEKRNVSPKKDEPPKPILEKGFSPRNIRKYAIHFVALAITGSVVSLSFRNVYAWDQGTA